MKRNRPDKDGTHRGAFEKNKKKIYATQTVCGICGKPVDFSLKYPHPLSPSETEAYVAQTRAVVKVCGDDGNNGLLKAVGKHGGKNR